MKKMLQSLLLLFFIVAGAHAQEGHKINVGVDYSFGWHYTLSQKGNPQLVAGHIGYEFDIVPFLGIEAGIGGGGFTQRIGLGGLHGDNLVYKGSFFSPYISPKLYLPIKYEDKIGRAHYLFIENKFAYNRLNWNFDKLENKGHSFHHQFEYTVKFGYQYPVGRSFTLLTSLGYSTFDFYRFGEKETAVKLKTSTPITIEIGFSYILKFRNRNKL